MPSNVLSSMAARAKAHHDSLNAAYQATYSLGTSTASTPTTSRKNSSTSVSSEEQPDRNITKAWKALKKHHQDMNQAYSVFYSQGMVTSAGSSRTSSAAPTPKASFEAPRVASEEKPRNYEKVWKAIKTRAVEHHKSVNNAAAAVYGA
jgi:hypothetical protein